MKRNIGLKQNCFKCISRREKPTAYGQAPGHAHMGRPTAHQQIREERRAHPLFGGRIRIPRVEAWVIGETPKQLCPMQPVHDQLPWESAVTDTPRAIRDTHDSSPGLLKSELRDGLNVGFLWDVLTSPGFLDLLIYLKGLPISRWYIRFVMTQLHCKTQNIAFYSSRTILASASKASHIRRLTERSPSLMTLTLPLSYSFFFF